jgi:DNA-binding NarL/FixJ family response regulator
MPIRILLADDHTLFRNGLKKILQEHPSLDVVAEAANGLEAVELARQYQPDVALMDISMAELSGLEATAQIAKYSPKTAVMILSMHSDERYVVRSVKAGARGYVLKDSVEDGLIQGIHALAQGEAYFSPAVETILRSRRRRDLGGEGADDPYERLTDRERQLYHLLAEGLGNKEIAARLGLSVHTVETHRTRIMEKLELRGIAELVLNAVRRGFVS